MATKRQKTETKYIVHWYCNGFCYRTTTRVPKHSLQDYKDIAKLIGDKIVIEKERY